MRIAKYCAHIQYDKQTIRKLHKLIQATQNSPASQCRIKFCHCWLMFNIPAAVHYELKFENYHLTCGLAAFIVVHQKSRTQARILGILKDISIKVNFKDTKICEKISFERNRDQYNTFRIPEYLIYQKKFTILKFFVY